MARAALIAGLVLAAFPAYAIAQPFSGPFPQPEEEYGPGITVSGAGFARVTAPAKLTEESVGAAVEAARPRAVSRAVADARARAESIAAAVDVALGEVDAVELQSALRERRPCRRSRRTQDVRCVVPPLVGASAEVTFEIAGGASSSDGARELIASGTGSAEVKTKRQTSPAIRQSLSVARLEATPEAARAARARVELAAQAAGLAVGAPFSIVEQTNPYGYEPLLGVFGPGRFCGLIRRGVVRRDPETGSRRLVRRRRVRHCFSPRTFEVRLEATYLAG
jgi:uncharacterized protein YggE